MIVFLFTNEKYKLRTKLRFFIIKYTINSIFNAASAKYNHTTTAYSAFCWLFYKKELLLRLLMPRNKKH